MKDKVWFVAPGTSELASAYAAHPAVKRIAAAQAFTVSLRSVMVEEDLDGFLRKDNDILITTAASLGDRPVVQRVHYYEDDLPARTVIKDFIAETMFVCDDYSGTSRLWLEVNITEADTDTGERKGLVSGFTSLAATAGAAFPVVMPYAMIAAGAARAMDKLAGALEKNTPVIKCPVALYPPDRQGAPLQPGNYVVFANPVDGGRYELQGNFELALRSGDPADVSYAVFSVETVRDISPQWIVSQRVATLLTQLDKGNSNSPLASIDFLNGSIQQYSNFVDLKRYLELARKAPSGLTEEEKQLMARIGAKDDLKPFLPKQAGT